MNKWLLCFSPFPIFQMKKFYWDYSLLVMAWKEKWFFYSSLGMQKPVLSLLECRTHHSEILRDFELDAVYWMGLWSFFLGARMMCSLWEDGYTRKTEWPCSWIGAHTIVAKSYSSFLLFNSRNFCYVLNRYVAGKLQTAFSRLIHTHFLYSYKRQVYLSHLNTY